MTEKHRKPGSSDAGAERREAASRPGRAADAGSPTRPPEVPPGPEPFSAVELRRISTHITTQWFLPVEGNRLTLMEIDPWRVHAYWSVGEADLVAARERLPGAGQDAVLVLRFTDLSPRTADAAPPHPRFDIEVQGARNNWYIGLWRDAKHYSAELGLRAPEGAFASLLRSNAVVTPRAGPSPELDFRHLEVRAPRARQLQPVAAGADRNAGLLRDLFPKRPLPEAGFPLARAARSPVLLEEPPCPAPEEDSEAIGPAAADAADAAQAPTESAAWATAGFPTIAAAQLDPYRAAARRVKASVLAEIGWELPPVAEEAIAPSDVDLQPQGLPLVGSSSPVAEEAGELGRGGGGGYSLGGPGAPGGSAAVWRPAIPLEAVLAGAVSSPAQGASPVEVVAEVVIRGRSTAGAPLSLCGKPIQLDAEGAFRLLVPLERGTALAELVRRLCGRYGDEGDG